MSPQPNRRLRRLATGAVLSLTLVAGLAGPALAENPDGPGGHRLPGIVRLLSGDSDVSRHRLRLRRAGDVDDEVRAWLCEAYRMATDR